MHPRLFLKRHGVTLLLFAFCAVMTGLLVRSELFPESSWVRRLPPELVLNRVLGGDSQSSLNIWWKGERVGSCFLRVFPGTTTRLHGMLEGYLPVLGKRHTGRFEVDGSVARLRGRSHSSVAKARPYDLQTLRLRGKVEDVSVEIHANAAENLVRWRIKGGGMDEAREVPLRELAAGGVDGLREKLGELPPDLRIPRAGQMASAVRGWKLLAAATRVQRRGSPMDAFLVEARLDANWWARLWVSPTGELLKLESSFGLRALNEDFFGM